MSATRAVNLGKHLRELRVHLCQTGESSKGVRDFIKNGYVSLKKSNPGFPILIRECSGVQPKIWARYEKGKECCVNVANLEEKAILDQIVKLNKSI